MKIDLKSYMDERDKTRDYFHSPGPVITISREHGCDAQSLANGLTKAFSAPPYEVKQSWKLINKEILQVASEELHVSQNRIRDVLDSKTENLMGNIFSSFGQPYGVSDKKVLETVRDVIGSFAVKGHVIVIGRGGAQIARDIVDSFHIKLQAPKNWRIKQIQQKWKLTEEEATSQCTDIDAKRISWNEQLGEGSLDKSIYDIVLNRQTLDDEQLLKNSLGFPRI